LEAQFNEFNSSYPNLRVTSRDIEKSSEKSKLDDLAKDVKEIGIKVDEIDQKTDAILNTLRSMQIVDEVSGQMQIMMGDSPVPHSVVAVQGLSMPTV
jgi:hypothetical protein